MNDGNPASLRVQSRYHHFGRGCLEKGRFGIHFIKILYTIPSSTGRPMHYLGLLVYGNPRDYVSIGFVLFGVQRRQKGRRRRINRRLY